MSKRLVGALGVLALLVIAGIVVALTGVGRSGSPSASRRPSAAASKRPQGSVTTEPSTTTPTMPSTTTTTSALPLGSWTLPSPKRYEGVVGVGFPHTTLGAVAMGFNEMSAQTQVNPSIAASAVEDVALNPTPALGQQVAQGIERLRARYGISPTGPTPDTISLSLEACRVQQVAPDRVVAGYEGVLVVQGPSIQGITANISAALPMVWNGSDWKVDTAGASLPQPPIAFPGAPGASADGWHPCAEG